MDKKIRMKKIETPDDVAVPLECSRCECNVHEVWATSSGLVCFCNNCGSRFRVIPGFKGDKDNA